MDGLSLGGLSISGSSSGRAPLPRSGSSSSRGSRGSALKSAGRHVAATDRRPPSGGVRPVSGGVRAGSVRGGGGAAAAPAPTGKPSTAPPRRRFSGRPVPASAPGEPRHAAGTEPGAREPLTGFVERKRVGIKRAKHWSPEVENAFRLQQLGWRDIDEYVLVYGRPEVWPETSFYSMLISKESGFFTYWRQHRECEDKYVPRVKLFDYEEGSGPGPVATTATYAV